MRSKLTIRIASVLMLFFTIGHSIRHLTRYNTGDIQTVNTITAMQSTKIPMMVWIKLTINFTRV